MYLRERKNLEKGNPFCTYTKNFKIDENTKPSVRMGRKTQGSLVDSRAAEISHFRHPAVFFLQRGEKSGQEVIEGFVPL